MFVVRDISLPYVTASSGCLRRTRSIMVIRYIPDPIRNGERSSTRFPSSKGTLSKEPSNKNRSIKKTESSKRLKSRKV